MARKRLPTPAMGKRIATCSGVSMVSWSGVSVIASRVSMVPGPGSGMISNHWIEQRQGLWQRLDLLLGQAEASGLKSLNGEELRELGLLYRQGAQDLSRVRADRGSRTQEEYLNLLLARAHNRVYSGKKLEARQVARFFAVEYPRIFRKLSGYVAIAGVIFVAGGGRGGGAGVRGGGPL